MKSSETPVARKNGLVVQEVADEVLVYDLDTNKAHCLNETAAMVWRNCDGTRTVSDISKVVEGKLGGKVNEDLIWLALDQLGEKDLLEEKRELSFSGRSRREVIRKIGLATAVAIPLVASLTTPTSVLAAASCACTAGNPAPCAATTCPSTTNCNLAGQCAP
ncbi:MAG: PqqD family protein [Pyrinomonadaceae bacterium]